MSQCRFSGPRPSGSESLGLAWGPGMGILNTGPWVSLQQRPRSEFQPSEAVGLCFISEPLFPQP